MRKTHIIILLFSLVIMSCTDVRLIGKVNMISNRNISEGTQYGLISTYSGGSNREKKNSDAESIEDAIDQTVRNVAGGEYMMNVKIYIVNNKYFAVEGDVWGRIGSTVQYRGFKTGDRVTWKSLGSYFTGSIIALMNDEKCLIKTDYDGETTEKRYDDLTRVDAQVPNQQYNNTPQYNTAPPPVFAIGDKVTYIGVFRTIHGTISEINGTIVTISWIDKGGNTKLSKVQMNEIIKQQ